MNLRNNKGIVTIDASIAVLILIILVPTITGFIYNLNKTSTISERNIVALNIMTNTIELAKSIGLDDSYSTDEEFLEFLLTKLQGNDVIKKNYDNDGMSFQINSDDPNIGEGTIYKNEIPYKVVVLVEDYSKKDTTMQENKMKNIMVSVTYKVSGKEKTLDLNTNLRK